jgi:hypothetical protein
MGSDGNAVYEQSLFQYNNEGPVYYKLSGWVKTIEEAELYKGRYERFSIVDATLNSSFQHDFSIAASASLCSYEQANDGYKINLVFSLEALGNHAYATGTKINVIIGLEYDGIPYAYRYGDNTPGLKTSDFNRSEGYKKSTITYSDTDYLLQEFYQWSNLQINKVNN